MDHEHAICRNAARGLRDARHAINAIAREASILAEREEPASRIAAELAQSLNAALLDYEVGLAEAGRHKFFDGRRNKRLRAPSSDHHARCGTRAALEEIAGRLEAIVLNGRLLDRLLNGCNADAPDGEFFRRTGCAYLALQAALETDLGPSS